MKFVFLLSTLLLSSLTLWGAGSSGDYLVSPENSETTTKQFGGTSDTLDRGGWYFEGSKGYARKEGVALPKSAGGTLCYDLPEGVTDTIYQLTVTCRTATKSSVGKEQILSVGLVGVEETFTKTFVTSSQTSDVKVTFTFDDFPTITGLRFSNLGTTIFEIASVEWISAFPPLEANIFVQSKVIAGSPFSYSVNSITGGSGSYPVITVSCQNTTHVFTGGDLPVSGDFTSPSVSGTLEVSVYVKDSQGNEFTETQTVEVTPYAPPTHLQVSNVTRESLDLSWTLSTGTTPNHYQVVVSMSPATQAIEQIFAPTWELDEKGYWNSAEEYDLSDYTDGFKITSCLLTLCSDEGAMEYSGNGGETWNKATKLGSSYMTITSKITSQKIKFRTSTAKAPRYIVLNITTNRKLLDYTFDASAQTYQHTVTGLPAGANLEVKLAAVYQKEDGKTASMISDVVPVEMEQLPGFADIDHYPKWKLLQFTWPEVRANLSGDIRIFAANAVENLTPKGLYLTRVYWTKKENGLTTGKAVAITNTTNVPIHLKGQYKLQGIKQDTGTVRTWDFSQKDADGNVTYPYIIAPGEDLVIAHASYLPLDVRETLVTSTATVLNFTDAWQLSIVKDELVSNTLTPQLNTLVRLAEDSLETLNCTEITADLPKLDALYKPWTKIEEIVVLDKVELQQTSASNQLNYSPYLRLKTSSRRIWASCRTVSGEARSSSTDVTLWEAPLPKKGFRFSIR